MHEAKLDGRTLEVLFGTPRKFQKKLDSNHNRKRKGKFHQYNTGIFSFLKTTFYTCNF